MPTLKQTRANRLNAQKCTGPSSAEGKARSSSNALKSGIQAESEVLPWEDPAERAAVSAEYTNCHHPRTPEERLLVDNLAHAEFLFRRFRRAEVKIVISKIPDGADLDDDAVIGQVYADASGELGRLQRRFDATNRAFHRDLDQLRLLEAERPPFEPPPPLILVPNQPDPPPDEPAAAAPEPDPPAPSPEPPPAEPVADPEPEPPAPSPEPAPTAPVPQPPVVVLVGLNRILSELSKNLTPTQLATLTLREAAALRRSPTPEPADPDLSTSQPIESTTQTQQMVSFGKNPEVAAEPPQAPNPQPQPPTPASQPRGFNPNNPNHPFIQLCHSCNQLDGTCDDCNFRPLPEHLLPGRR